MRVPPMFLSDFEHAFFLAEANAKIGHVTAVRRVWGSEWEVYRIEAAGARADGCSPLLPDGTTAAVAGVERPALAHRCERKPKSADLLAAYVRRRHAQRQPRRGVPARTEEEAWEAEDGWGL